MAIADYLNDAIDISIVRGKVFMGIHTGDTVVKKVSTIKDFVESIKQLDTKYESPLLPANTLKITESANDMKISLFSPARRTTLNYCTYRDGTSERVYVPYENALIPSHIFRFSVQKQGSSWRFRQSWCYSVKENDVLLVDSKTPLFRMWFPNVYSDNKICWGNNAFLIGDLKNLYALNGAMQSFFASPFNNDLWHAQCGVNSVDGLFKASQQCKDLFCPDEWYRRATDNNGKQLTIGDL